MAKTQRQPEKSHRILPNIAKHVVWARLHACWCWAGATASLAGQHLRCAQTFLHRCIHLSVHTQGCLTSAVTHTAWGTPLFGPSRKASLCSRRSSNTSNCTAAFVVDTPLSCVRSLTHQTQHSCQPMPAPS